MFERDENDDDVRSQLMAGFEAFDKGDLTADNVLTFELPAREPAAKTESDGGASGASQGERGGQQTGKADSSPATSAAAKPASGEQPRDPAGRYAQKDGQQPAAQAKPDKASADPSKPADKPAEQQPKPQDGASNTQSQPPAASAEQPPQGLGSKASALWGTATPEMRSYIAETESALAKVAPALEPVFATARELGIPWNKFLGNLVSVENGLRQSPLDTMLWIAKQSNVDLDELADYAAGVQKNGGASAIGGQQQAVNPDLQRAIAPILQEVTQLKSQLTQREQDERAARHNAARREIDAFANDPANGHWKSVEQTVYGLLPSIRQSMPNASIPDVLRAAYDRAIWAHPEVREKVMQAQRAAEADRQRQARSRDLEAITGHRGAPSQARPTATNGQATSLRDEIAANWAIVDAR